MATVVSRTIRSSPHRDALQTWDFIVELLTQGKDSTARKELRAVAGVAASLISDQTPKSDSVLVTSDGTRTRIYCLYDDAAIEDEGNEASLGYDPLKGNWALSLPCPADELSWVQAALKKHSSRISARDPKDTSSTADARADAVAGDDFSVDVGEFLKP